MVSSAVPASQLEPCLLFLALWFCDSSAQIAIDRELYRRIDVDDAGARQSGHRAIGVFIYGLAPTISVKAFSSLMPVSEVMSELKGILLCLRILPKI
jgi:hypothetical protein